MKACLLILTGVISFTLIGVGHAQEQDPTFYGPSQLLRKIYHKVSHGTSKTGVDVRSNEVCSDCGQTHDCDAECIQRCPVPDCVTGKKKIFCSSIRYEYVVVAEVRYRWKMKCITKEVPADFEEPHCKTEDGESLNNVQDWDSCDSCEGKVYCENTKSDPDGVECKRIECEPGQTTIKVKYKSLVKEPYTVYRQIKRPIAIKQPRYECVEVPVTRYEGRRLNKD